MQFESVKEPWVYEATAPLKGTSVPNLDLQKVVNETPCTEGQKSSSSARKVGLVAAAAVTVAVIAGVVMTQRKNQ